MKRELSHGRQKFLLAALLCLPSFGVQWSHAAADEKKPPAEQYQTLVKEVEDARQEYFKQSQQAKTDEERSKLDYPNPEKYTGGFIALASAHPKDEAAVDALVWVAQNANRGEDFEKALNLLRTGHLTSPKLGPVCQSLTYSPSESAEKLLRALIEQSTHREVQGQAAFGLAQFLKNRAETLNYLSQPMAAEHSQMMERYYGKENLARLRATPIEKVLAEAERLFEQASGQYADLAHFRGTIGESAKAALYELRNLAIGQTAPEIEGEDIDGVRFKLSDYRGKVVVLDFWGDW